MIVYLQELNPRKFKNLLCTANNRKIKIFLLICGIYHDYMDLSNLRIFQNRKFLSFPYLINLNGILNKIKGNKKALLVGFVCHLKSSKNLNIKKLDIFLILVNNP